MPNLSSPATINSSPCFENQGGWGAGFVLAKTRASGVTVGPGLDNPNVFAQIFPVDSKKHFKLAARARSATGQPGVALFQVNWMAGEGELISTSQRRFKVAAEEIAAEWLVAGPDDAVTGVIYVAPGSEDNIVQYYEMSLYLDLDTQPIPVKEIIPPPQSNVIRPSAPVKCFRFDNLFRDARDVNRPKSFWKNVGINHPLVFVHIPKTAGHSIYDLFKRNYSEDAIVMPYSGV